MAAFLLAVALAAVPSRGQELGEPVRLGPSVSPGPTTGDLLAPSLPSGAVLYESGPSQELAAFDTVLFHGRLTDPRVRLEAAVGEGAQGGWSPLEVHRTASGRFWARLRLASRLKGRMRLRAVSEGASSFSGEEIYAVEAFAAEPEPPPPQSPISFPAAVEPLPLVTREAWGARPPRAPFRADEPLRMTLHHTSGPQPVDAKAAAEEMRFIQDLHQNGRGWDDVAYHFVVDGAGRIYEGRPLSAVGAHTKNNNAGNVGICLMGNFEPPASGRPTQAQLDAVVLIGRYLRRAFGIPASTLKGHRDYVDTDCPGSRAYRLLAGLRALIASDAPPARPSWARSPLPAPRFD